MSYGPLLNAISFAAEKHRIQKRKDKEESPWGSSWDSILNSSQ